MVCKVVESPLAKLVSVANVLRVVDVNKRFALIVLVEYTFESVLGFFDKLGPLGFEKLVVLNLNLIIVESFQSLANRDCFEEHRV